MTDTLTTTPNAPPPAGLDVQDAAWVRVPTTLSMDTLTALLDDTEALLRLNPYYYFRKLKRLESGRWQAEFENQSNQQQVATEIEVRRESGGGTGLYYASGLKKRTLFTLEPAPHGGVLVITDDYTGTPETERQACEAEIDKSLVAWGEALRKYCLRLQRYSRLPGWRWYIRRVWIPMKPSGRRIVWLLALISLVEFVFFCFVLLIWVIEKNR